MKQLKKISFIIFLTAIVLACSSENKEKQTQQESESPGLGKLPDITMTTMSGEEITFDDLKGKVVFLNFWATWCAPCRREIPDFISFQEKYGGDDFTIIGVSLDEEGFEVVKPYAEEMGINYPLVVDEYGLGDELGGIFAVPTTYFVNEKGDIVGRKIGYFPEEEMKEQIKNMLDV